MKRYPWWFRVPVAKIAVVLCALLPTMTTATEPAGEPSVEFNRDVRPILAAKCFQCHGPDEAKRQAELRLDTKEGASTDLGGYRPIVPGDAGASEVVRRITSADDDERMPPADSELTLNQQEIDAIRRWIDQGAKWQEHWSFIPPKRPTWPKVSDPSSAKNGIDVFVQARLEREGLTPSPEADKAPLFRRVTLDLTGLPPTIEEVEQFLADDAPDAYERAVDRLLASPAYGERMAADWLNAARFADTSGYQTDGVRYMWRWRDWVIEAFNRNEPFDQFTIDQVAGDMLPDSTLDQLIATGFNRNHRANSEGGIIPEEYLVEYAVDRVGTTCTVWLGLTMGCARCHEHKFDPFTQEEFYQVLAYFNNVPERGRVIKYGNSPPVIKAPTTLMLEQLDALERELTAARDEFERFAPELASAQRAWEASFAESQSHDWTISDGLAAYYSLDGHANDAIKENQNGIHQGTATYTDGRIGGAVEFDGNGNIEIAEVPPMSGADKFTLCTWVLANEEQQGSVLARMDEKDDSGETGISIQLNGDKVRVNFGPRWLDDAVKVETRSSLPLGTWHHVAMTYDGSQMADGLLVYVDGVQQETEVLLDLFTGTFTATQPLLIGSRIQGGRFRGAIDDVCFYQRELTPRDVRILACADSIAEIVAVSSEQRSRGQAEKIAAYFLDEHAPDEIRQASERVAALIKRKEQLEETIPTTMVMRESETPRDTYVLVRGEYDKPGEKVGPGVPQALSPLPPGATNDRFGFARWLVSPANPLTARVVVNRFWQMYFGTGIVKTVEDFGSQGEWPSHPELLDWLAIRFVESGWDTKEMQRLIVTSATYRQASDVTPQLERRDPENRLLARGPRFRLSAQAIRDQALAVSGLMVDRVGGPSVKPYQPPGLWKELTNAVEYDQDSGADLYRRSMYTFWKRTVAPPSMATFDSPGRETCVVRQSRTNTPLQALALLNEVTYVEAARMLAERMMTEGGTKADERIVYGFKRATARPPSARELEILINGLARYREEYQGHADAAQALITVGESEPDENLDPAELAAYTAVASVILNLDEVITKQ